MKKTKIYDAIIVGAGAAGLACAIELLKKEKNILILEARSRVGGRAFTKLHPETKVPLELGAEFIHGNPKSIMDLAQKAHLSFYDVLDKHHYFDQKTRASQSPQFWNQLQALLKKIPKHQEQSIAEFLSRQKNKKSKELFRSFVEGFHAADTAKMSCQGLLDAEQINKEDSLNGSELFRWQNGYVSFFERLRNQHPDLNDRLILNSVVKEIHQTNEKIKIYSLSRNSGQLSEFECRKLVITIPLGVLKAAPESTGGIRWFPGMPQDLVKALSFLEMGHVQRLNLRFKTRFWEKLTDKPESFFHTTADHYFPTWWTLMPVRSTHLIAWQGGPKAEEMANWSEQQKITAAIKTLSELGPYSENKLFNELIDCHSHNWSQDPYTLGAYSYIHVGGLKESKKLSKVFGGNILIAGEAAASGSGRGTIHGAIESGEKAAQLV